MNESELYKKLGEMGLSYPISVQEAVPVIASFCDSPTPLLRERSVNSLGRIGRGSYQIVERYWKDLFRFASDDNQVVRIHCLGAIKAMVKSLETNRLTAKNISPCCENNQISLS